MNQTIVPLKAPVNADIRLPGSKSIVNRVLLITAMASGKTTLHNLLFSDDTEAMLSGLEALGVAFELDREKAQIVIEGCDGAFPNQSAKLYCRDSGTMTRFLIPMLAAQRSGTFYVDGSARMRERPIKGALDCLKALGAEIEFHEAPDQMPLTIHAKGITGGTIAPPVHESTQILSGLAMAGVYAKSAITLEWANAKKAIQNKPYIQMSLDLMAEFGGTYAVLEDAIRIQAGGYRGKRYDIEPDLSTASYFFGAAALTGGEVRVHHIPPKPLQGDVRFLAVLSQMGCTVNHVGTTVTVNGPKVLKGVDVDMRNFSDTFMTLSALASFAQGETRIRNIAHTRLQESDRIEAISAGLKILGADVTAFEDGVRIKPASLHGGVVSGCNDHRIAMSLGLIGLMIPGVEISGAECVKKTCPDYFKRMADL